MSRFDSASRFSLSAPGSAQVAEPGVFNQALDGVLGGLSTIGTIGDTVGSVARGLLVGDVERAFGGIFDVDQRVTGNELIGRDSDEFSWLGFGTEVITDPLTYTGIGLTTKAGKVAQAAGRLRSVEKAQRQAFKATGSASVGARLKSTQEALKRYGSDAEAVYAAKIGDQFASGQRSLLSLDIPFTDINIPLTGTLGRSTGNLADKVSEQASQTKLVQGIKKKFMPRETDPYREALRQEAIAIKREAQIDGLNISKKLEKVFDGYGATEKAVRYAQAVDIIERTGTINTGIAPSKIIEYGRRSGGRGIGRAAELYNDLVEIYGNLPKEILEAADEVYAFSKDTLDVSKRANLALDELQDMGYVPRLLTVQAEEFMRENKAADIMQTLRSSIGKLAGTGSQQARKLTDTFIVQVNKTFREQYDVNFDLLETDLSRLVVRRAHDTGKAQAESLITQAVAESAEDLGRKVKVDRRKKVLVSDLMTLKNDQRQRLVKGQLVTSTKVPVNLDDTTVPKHLATSRSGKINWIQDGDDGYHVINNYKVKSVNDLKTYTTEMSKANVFKRISEGHAKFFDQLKETTFSPGQQRFIRAFMSTVDEADLPNLDVVDLESFRDIIEIYADRKWLQLDEEAKKLFGSFNNFELQMRGILLNRVDDNLVRAKFVDILPDFEEWRKAADAGAELYPEVDRVALENFNVLPKNARINLYTDLLKDPITRTNYVEIPPAATPDQIKRALKEYGLETAVIDRELYDFAVNVLEIGNKGIESPLLRNTLNIADKVHSLYRTALTQYFPAFHVRNWFSGVFMNSMAGLNRPGDLKHYYTAMSELKNMSEDRLTVLTSMGVLNSGQLRETVEIGRQAGFRSRRLANLAGTKGTRALKQTHETVLKAGYALENHVRLAHFNAMKARGMSEYEAAESVRKWLFDYNDLTPFEKAVPRRAMLFYTFFRKNVPLMLEQTLKNPRVMVNYARATGQTNPNLNQPEWLPDSFFFGENDQEEAIRVNFGLPPEDLARFDPSGQGISRAAELLINSLVPAIRVPYEVISGRDTFRGQALEGGLVDRALRASPLSRLVATAEQASSLEPGQFAFRFGTGIAVRSYSDRRTEISYMLDKIEDRLNFLQRSGQVRQMPIFINRQGQQNEELRQLNSLRAKLLNELCQTN